MEERDIAKCCKIDKQIQYTQQVIQLVYGAHMTYNMERQYLMVLLTLYQQLFQVHNYLIH